MGTGPKAVSPTRQDRIKEENVIYLSISRVVPTTKATIMVANGIQLINMRSSASFLTFNIFAQIKIVNGEINKGIEFVL